MPQYGDWPTDMERYFSQLSRMGKRPTIVFTEHLQAPAWTPALDMYETEEAVVVVLELAGVNPRDVDVQAEPGRLVVRGVRRERERDGERVKGARAPEQRRYHALEIPRGRFERSLPLPSGLTTEETHATYHAGFLEIVIPRRAPRQVRIQVEESLPTAEQSS